MTPTGKTDAPYEPGSNQTPTSLGGRDDRPVSDAEVILSLSDLIQDSNGEVVLFNDSQFDSVELSSDTALIGQGVVDRHVTAAGDDVSGFRFVAFANGLKLFFAPNLRVTVRNVSR